MRHNQSWYIAKVVTVDDPAKRRRIQARGPKETEEALPTEKLSWLQPIQLHSDSFSLPAVDESVLVLQFNDQRFWLDLPNKAAWQDFGDDYLTAWLFTHKDVLSAMYKESVGFEFKLTGNIKLETNKTTLTITDESVEFVFDKATITTDGTSLTAKINDVEISTDGSKVTIKNGGQNLATLIDELHTALQSHTHTTAMGPSGISINAADFSKNQSNFAQLLQ